MGKEAIGRKEKEEYDLLKGKEEGKTIMQAGKEESQRINTMEEEGEEGKRRSGEISNYEYKKRERGRKDVEESGECKKEKKEI